MPDSSADERDARVVVSWDDSAAIQLAYLPAPPIVTGVGMRPERLSDQRASIYYPSNAEWYEHMHRRLTRLATVALRRYQAGQVLSGMSLGWDTALAEAALALGLPLRVALPFKGLQSDWQDHHKQRFSRLVGKAHEVVALNKGGYRPWKVKRALEHRIQESGLVLALWDRRDSLAKEGVRLAYAHEKQVVNLWSSWVRYGQVITARPQDDP